MRKELDEFTRAYVVAMLWSEDDDKGEPLDKSHGLEDFADEAVQEMVKDCARFQKENSEDIRVNIPRAGHDFLLTRNGHGAGFWDGDWPKEAGERLTLASEKFGEKHAYIGDDGKIYLI